MNCTQAQQAGAGKKAGRQAGGQAQARGKGERMLGFKKGRFLVKMSTLTARLLHFQFSGTMIHNATVAQQRHPDRTKPAIFLDLDMIIEVPRTPDRPQYSYTVPRSSLGDRPCQ
jgi:hypothetical protein